MPVQDASPQLFSNSVENFVESGFGPDQATIKVVSSEYSTNDYNGTMKNDPAIVVKWMCEPLDGSNEGKQFEVDWGVGPKLSEVSIMNEGGHLAPGPGSSKSGLSKNSNWAHAQKALLDAGFDPKLLDGPQGVRYFVGGEFTIKKVPQPKREGIAEKNEKGFAKTFYTFLRIDQLPGEAKKGAAARKTNAAPKAQAAAPAQAQATSNGNGAGAEADATSLVAAALAANGGSLSLADLPKALFLAAKAADPTKTAKENMAIAQAIATEDSIIGLAMENSWSFNNNILVG